MKKQAVKERIQFMTDKFTYSVLLICLLISGCTLRQAGYTTGGAAAGGGIGYAINHDGKEAAIGGLAGAIGGNLIGQWQDKSEKNKQDKSYKQGYSQANVDIATKNWEDNTGKGHEPTKQLVSFMIPKRVENDVIYDQQHITIEDYK